MARNLVTVSYDTLVCLRQGEGHPSDEEWEECMKILRSKDLSKVKVLVLTKGGSPTPRQQAALARVLAGNAVPVAVVSESAFVRFVVSSVALITKRIRTFQPSELDSALAHLQLSWSEREFVEIAMGKTEMMMKQGF
jgi:hypothetical protein